MESHWFFLILTALVLGIRHGFDLDHLATIDAITRTVCDNRLLSRLVGFFFSLGHGFVVILISLIIGSGIVQAHAPEWLGGFGRWVSIFFLLVFGLLNLYNVFQTPSDEAMCMGLKSFLAKKITPDRCKPTTIMSIGALFALSFDTVSQIALFGVAASLSLGALFSGVLGLFFTLGMMIADGLNGWLVAWLIQRADKTSLIFSRGLGLAISIFSLWIGGRALFEALPSVF